MKKLITAIIVIASSTLFAQDNTLPTTGRVGVGTLTPSARLDVNGNMIIDSCLLIKDSLIVNKAVRAMDRMIVEQKMTMKGNAVVKQNFKVSGNSRVDGNLRTIGNSKVEGLLKLPNTGNLSNANINAGNFDVLLLNANGTAKKLDYSGFLEKLIGGIYKPAPASKCDGGLPVSDPKWANGTNKLYSQCPQVFVGIGNSAPRASLDVTGTTYSQRIVLGFADPTSGQQELIYAKTSLNSPQTKLLLIENQNRKLLTLDNSGLLRAREIKVDAQAWPDYVFEKNYKLMPLREVENYIQENGHLPNVPSAKEIEKEGINLGEMDSILLQKIEELTLYILDQEKRISELENSQK